jgi:uncharacterized protein
MRGLFCSALLVLPIALPAAAQTEPARPVVLPSETILRVQGEGSVAAKPSRMIVTIGVETTGATAAEALDANNRKLAPVIEALRNRGIPASDIQSSSLDVSPIYSDDDDLRITGFQASNNLSVTSRDLGKAGELISLLFDAGANSIDGPEFLVGEDQMEPLARLAEADALREARAQAESTARALGMKVSRILLVSDSQVKFRSGSGYVITVTASRIARPTPIEPGEITVSAEYDVEFALVPM